jgi:hypothetical protein
MALLGALPPVNATYLLGNSGSAKITAYAWCCAMDSRGSRSKPVTIESGRGPLEHFSRGESHFAIHDLHASERRFYLFWQDSRHLCAWPPNVALPKCFLALIATPGTEFPRKRSPPDLPSRGHPTYSALSTASPLKVRWAWQQRKLDLIFDMPFQAQALHKTSSGEAEIFEVASFPSRPSNKVQNVAVTLSGGAAHR